MSSKTAKPKEKDLYAPYKEELEGIFDRYYFDKSQCPKKIIKSARYKTCR